MMRITLDSPALVAVRTWLTGTAERSGRTGRRAASRLKFRTEQLEPRTMLDAGMRAGIPDLADESDTGSSTVDNLTSDRTPALSGSVQGGASEVRVRIDGKRVAVVPVVHGKWAYTVPAEAALGAGMHTIAVRPVAAPGTIGALSKELAVTVGTTPPAASTLVLGPLSDTGVRGDGQTTYATPTFRGVAQPGRLVNVSIDGEFVGQVKSDAKTGAWLLKSPRLANGTHDVTAVVENRVGLPSAPTSLQVTVNGLRTVMLDATGGQAVELTASHLLGQGSQGFIVTEVHRGTLQKWSAAKNEWLPIPGRAMTGTDPASLQKAAAIRKISFNDVIQWKPASGDVGITPAFALCPSDTAGGPTAPTPAAGTVPGQLVDTQVAPLAGGIGQAITWEDPTDGCGCPSTRYSIEVTREDGRTLVYNVPRTVHGIPIVEGGTVQQMKLWGATKTGAGEAWSLDLQSRAEAVAKFSHTLTSRLSFIDLGAKARSQLANSPTGTQFTTSLPLGNHANLAYLQVDAVPDATEAAQNLPAGNPMIVSSDSSKLTPKQRADLKTSPIYASQIFPGIVNGEVQPDQVRAHFQAGETLRFSGNVDARVRTGATIVVESAQNLGDGSLGPWFEEARISVGADGGFSHDYVVPYGLNSVRTRLEYRTQPTAPAMRSASEPTLGATSSTSAPISTPIDLSSSFNAFGITTAPWQVPNNQGFDRNGNYYNSDYTGSGTKDPIPGTPITYNGITFPIGPIPTEDGQVGGGGNSAKKNPPNFVQAKGQTIDVSVDADKSDYLYLAGAASNGDQMSQKITLKFTDGTTETWTQSFHDWASVGPPQQDATTPASHGLLQVKVVATSSIAATGLQTIDGVALVANDRVLLQNQSDAAQNGVYVVQSGSWTLAADADTSAEILGSYTTVVRGTYAGKTFLNTNTGTITLGTTPITFVEGTPPQPAPRPFTGELLLKTQPERINQLGDLVTTPAHIFAYCYNLKGKQLAGITLPNNENVGILSAVVAKAPVIALDGGIASLVLGTTNLTGIDVMALTIKNESNIGAGGGPLTFFFADQPVKGSTTTPPTYTTKQVTVPMGQQTTIAYIAPDSTSQMNFYVQKADGTCVGPNCSTYLTNWNNGSSKSDNWAANISPSLNSQLKPGQHWTMTIQNTEEGYNGYLDSPSGKNTVNGVLGSLPAANGSTPAGAQFKLQTQAEITAQPKWAVVTEDVVGAIVGLVIVSVATAGVADVVFAGVAEGEAEAAVTVVEVGGDFAGEGVAESVSVDAVYGTVELTAESVTEYGGVESEMIYFEDEFGLFSP